MKMFILAALVAATPAMAQTTNSPPQQATATDPAQAAPADSSQPAPADSSMAAPAAPADPAMAAPMAPAAGTPTMGPMASNTPPAATGDYPVCSKTVTDHCKERNSKK